MCSLVCSAPSTPRLSVYPLALSLSGVSLLLTGSQDSWILILSLLPVSSVSLHNQLAFFLASTFLFNKKKKKVKWAIGTRQEGLSPVISNSFHVLCQCFLRGFHANILSGFAFLRQSHTLQTFSSLSFAHSVTSIIHFPKPLDLTLPSKMTDNILNAASAKQY